VPCPGSFTHGERTLGTLWTAAWVNARTDVMALANNNNKKKKKEKNKHQTYIMGNNITSTI